MEGKTWLWLILAVVVIAAIVAAVMMAGPPTYDEASRAG